MKTESIFDPSTNANWIQISQVELLYTKSCGFPYNSTTAGGDRFVKFLFWERLTGDCSGWLHCWSVISQYSWYIWYRVFLRYRYVAYVSSVSTYHWCGVLITYRLSIGVSLYLSITIAFPHCSFGWCWTRASCPGISGGRHFVFLSYECRWELFYNKISGSTSG